MVVQKSFIPGRMRLSIFNRVREVKNPKKGSSDLPLKREPCAFCQNGPAFLYFLPVFKGGVDGVHGRHFWWTLFIRW